MDKAKVVVFCQRAIEFCMLLVIFSIPISIAMTNIAIVLGMVLWLAKKIINREPELTKTPLNLMLFLLVAISAVSMLHTIRMPSSITGLQKLFKGLFIFFMLVDTIRDSKQVNRVVWVALFALLLVSSDGVYQYFTGKDFIRGFPIGTGMAYLGQYSSNRISASMHNPNDFSVYLITAVPLLLSLVLFYLKGAARWLLLIAGLMTVFCIFFTFQRIVAVAFIAIMILFSIIKRDVKPILVLLLLVTASLYFLPRPILLWSIEHLNPYDFFVEVGGRRWHWEAALNMIKAHPFIGIGVNTFSINYDTYKIAADPLSGWYAHNAYLQLGAEIGLTGLFIFMWMIGAAIRDWFKAYVKTKTPLMQAVSLGFLGGFLGFLVSGLLESNLQYSNLAVLFWVMLGLLIAINKVSICSGQ